MNDLISRRALCEYALNQKDKSITPNDIMRFPFIQPDKNTIAMLIHQKTDYPLEDCKNAYDEAIIYLQNKSRMKE